MDTIPITNISKTCTKCNVSKPATNTFFSIWSSIKMPGKLNPWCKECVAEYGRKKRRENPEVRAKLEKREELKNLGLKVCCRCKETKLSTEEFFPRRSSTSKSLGSWCRQCNTEYWKLYSEKTRTENPDKERKRHALYRKNNKEKCSITQKTWIKNNKQRVIETRRKWRNNNPEKAALQQKRDRLRKYNMTPEEYDTTVICQGNLCAICGNRWKPTKHYPGLVVDHDHSTGKVRALLCNGCNKMLGGANDNPDILEKGAIFLRLHNHTNVAKPPPENRT